MAERTAALEASTVRLRDSEASLRAIFDNAGIGISVLNQDTGILQVNPTMQEMFGYTEAELLTMTMTALTHPAEALGDLEAFQRVCAATCPAIRLRNATTVKTGNYCGGVLPPPRSRMLPVSACVIGMLEDITERKRAEEELQRRAEAAAAQPRTRIQQPGAGRLCLYCLA